MKKFVLCALMLSPITAIAQDYQSISSVNYVRYDTKQTNTEIYSLSSQYFFSAKSTTGPLDQFDYINGTSNIFANYATVSSVDVDNITIGGDYFLGNILVGGSYHHLAIDNDDLSTTSLKLGYLLSNDLLITATATKAEDANTAYDFSAAYNYQINARDYIGFTFATDDEFDNKSIASKYFTALGNNNYFSVAVAYHDNKYEDYWSTDMSYYFNRNTSVSAGYDDNDEYRVGARYFINNNIAFALAYGSNTNDSDDDYYSLNMTAQF